MSMLQSRRNVRTETGLHPALYKTLVVGLAATMAIIWLAFGSDGYTGLQLAIAIFFCIMFVAVPYGMWLLWCRENTPAPVRPFREWASNELETATGPVEGKEAAAMVLLAPAAVALGLSVISAIAFLVARGLV